MHSGSDISYENILQQLQKNPSSLETLLAVIQTGDFTEEERQTLFAEAIGKDALSLSFIPVELRNADLCRKALAENWLALKYIPASALNKDDDAIVNALSECKDEFQSDYYLIDEVGEIPDVYLDDELKKLIQKACSTLVKSDWGALYSIPDKFITHEMCMASVKKNGYALEYVPVQFRDYACCLEAINKEPEAIKYLENPEQRILLSNNHYESLCEIVSAKSKVLADSLLKQKEQLFFEEINGISKKTPLQIVKYLLEHKNNPALATMLDKDYSPDKNLSAIQQLLKENPPEKLTKLYELLDGFTKAQESPDEWAICMTRLNELTPDEKSSFFTFMQNTNSQFSQHFAQLKEFFKNSHTNEINHLEQMIADKNPMAFLLVSLITPYTMGPDKLNLTYIHGLITCAETGSRKSYDFMPTILEAKEVDEYFKTLKEASLPLREKFSVASTHWRTGEIRIDDNGVNIALMDSMGLTEDDRYGTKEFIDVISNSFPSLSAVFFDKTKRQYSGMVCSVVSLDDLIHLFTVEKYLNEKDLFTYFISQKKDVETIPLYADKSQSIRIIPIELPLSMMRTMQHRRLKNEVIPGREHEKNMIINKKGQTAMENVKSSFIYDMVWQRETNKRVDEKLYKMASRSFTYLTSKPLDEIAIDMKKYTLRGLQSRIAEQKKNVKLQSPDETTSSPRRGPGR